MVQPTLDAGTAFRRTLRDGTVVEVAPLTAASAPRLQEAFEAMSPRSRYLRFMSPLHRLSDRDLRYLTEVDQVHHLAWGAVDLGMPGRPGVGVARCVRLADAPDVAEPALTVVDSHQGRGLGTLLFETLARAASARGIRTFRAFVLSENVPMLAMLRRDGARFAREGGGVLRADIDVDALFGPLAAA
jgi:GNAT superfamily N-acetyltransferase